MKITVKKLSELHEAEKNIRRHTDKQIKEYITPWKCSVRSSPSS